MNPELLRALAPSEYDKLPDYFKSQFSEKEYLWLSDGEKARLIQGETEPEAFDD